MTFEEYWMDCTHSPNHYAEISTAFKAGASSRDAEVAYLQYRIDELMLEYCPDEMTQEQLDNYAKHQVPVKGTEPKE